MDSHTYGPRGARKMYENSRSSNGTEHLARRRRRGVFSLKRFSAHERQPSSVFRIHPAGYALVFICMFFFQDTLHISDRLYVNILRTCSFDSYDTNVLNPISLNRQTAKTNLRMSRTFYVKSYEFRGSFSYYMVSECGFKRHPFHPQR